MENQHQKWVNLGYLVAATLLYYIALVAGQKLTALFDLETQVRNIDMVIRVGSIALGALFFFVLYKNQKTNGFMNEVVAELTKVTWPTQKETSSATMIVVIMVLISGLVLGFMDYVWIRLIQLVIN